MNETSNYMLFVAQLETMEDWYKSEVERAHVNHRPDSEAYFQSKLDMIHDIQNMAKACFS